jgi:asparagine synthase (glutamine-hydrolysing)
MRDSLTHRGPDDAGDYVAPGVALGSRRLAILDLSPRGHMPMATPDGRYHIAYNGEVYNYRELRRALEDRGHTFRSNTDTEVVLRLYVDEGPAMLNRLNGMFSIAIWDNVERVLFLARDRLGVKPLYYHCQAGEFSFASEEKAFFAGGLRPEFDADTWEELLCFRYVAGERTPYVGIKRLLPGHYLLWKDGKIKIQRWWHLGERARERRAELSKEPTAWFRETFDSAVDLRRISDVPIGVLLSGGLDSSSVAASLSAQGGTGLASFTVRFSEAGYDEGPLAQQVADRWQLKYHDLEIGQGELLSMLDQASRLNDEPLVHGNDLHLLAISRFAKSRVTVLLSGEGADETLGGYVRYQPLRFPLLLKAARPVFPRLVSAFGLNGRFRKLSRFLSLGSLDRFMLFNACDVLPEDLALLGMKPRASYGYREQVLDEAKSLYSGEPMRQAMYSDQHTFLCSILDRNDRMTMGASIECRVPFLDYRIVEMMAALPSSVILAGRQTKQVLRRAVGDRLPEAVRHHRKWGFGVPWAYYMRNTPEVRDALRELPGLALIKEGPFAIARVDRMVNRFLEGEEGNEALIKQLFMIAKWYQACFQANSQAVNLRGTSG